MTDVEQRDAKTRLNRIAGQVAGLGRMVDEDRYCVDILNQIAAVRSALDNLGVSLLTSHLQHCVAAGGEECENAHPQARGRSQQELFAEVQATLSRFLR